MVGKVKKGCNYFFKNQVVINKKNQVIQLENK